jgi:8-amino-7-oxononanoate synthase
VLKGLEVNAARGDELRRVLCDHTLRVLQRLDELGVYTPNESGYPIIEIPLRDHQRISEVGRFLFDNGVYVTLAAYPLVPKNDVGFRVQLTSANTDEQVDTLLAAIEDLAERGELRLDGEEANDTVEAAA